MSDRVPTPDELGEIRRWALAFYQRKVSEGKKHHEAVRALANVWVRIIFAMWQNHQPYDQEIFVAAQKKHQKQIA